MPPKTKTPVPVDRPLSRAYLREFGGWSTAYPPGVSEPNTLRVMENVMVTRDGSARVRPGLRSLMKTKSPLPIVGSHELFYTQTGKAYLVAVREPERIGFRVITVVDASGNYVMQTLQEAGFDVSDDPTTVSFSSETTYVRYLQIDNKVFALSNGPEPLLLFWVGAQKKARRLASIERPGWTAADRLEVVHPDSTWILGNVPSSTRRNLCTNPDFEVSRRFWASGNDFTTSWRSSVGFVGDASLGFRSLPERTNLCTRPLGDVARYGIAGWSEGPRCFSVQADGGSMKVRLDKQPSTENGFAFGPQFAIEGGKRYKIAFDLANSSNVRRWTIAVRYFRANGDRIGDNEIVGGGTGMGAGRKYSDEFVAPTQAAQARVLIGGYSTAGDVIPLLWIDDVFFGLAAGGTAALDGDDGTHSYWTGAPNASTSVYHPPQDIVVDLDRVGGSSGSYFASAHVRSDAPRTVEVQTRARNAAGSVVATRTGSATSTAGTWQRVDSGSALSAPSTTASVDLRVIVRGVPRGEDHRVDAVLLERSSTLQDYFSGSYPADTSLVKRRWAGDRGESQSIEDTYPAPGSTIPPEETPIGSTLISNNAERNVYTVGMFYTVSNDLGESAASQMAMVQVRRPWTGWLWAKPGADGAPTGGRTSNPNLCADQLVAVMPREVFDAAIAAGATHWTAYFTTWGPNDVPPVTGLEFAKVPLSPTSLYDSSAQVRLTPERMSIGRVDPPIPTENTRVNATSPFRGSQGIVAADRLVLVGNPVDPAQIVWSSAAPGDYHNFSPSLGGGSKQLTSGNLQIAATVKLWQNPQSVDTLTILTTGDDGRSSAYYMQPAQITSLSEAVNIMGFEETTSMLGTSSPYGCEVLNNALYHPLEHALVKSTANNYNLSHRSMTDMIENVWRVLQNHRRIVSSQLDQRLYFLVHNRLGAPLQPDCWGNEIWVCDIGSKTPTWSRWLVQGISLRAIEVGKKIMMSVVHPDGVFFFDQDRANDEVFDPITGLLTLANIPWRLETNTQGANRAHDAWANLQQLSLSLGNFEGQLRYGVRGHDVHGMPVDVSKIVIDTAPPTEGLVDPDQLDSHFLPLETFDREDHLLVRKMLKEWVFYAGSVDDVVLDAEGDEQTVPRYSAGQIDLVQYRYTPSTVNVGYEFGSVETFEYGSSALAGATTDSGVPKPYLDLSRPS